MGSPTVPRTFRDSRPDLHERDQPQAKRVAWASLKTSERSSLLHRLAAVLHQHPDGGRRRVELGHLIFVHHLPHATDVRVCGQALELEDRNNNETNTIIHLEESALLPPGGRQPA